MSDTLTADEFRRFTNTFEETLERNLNDRFDHYEKRAVAREDAQHKTIVSGFAEVIENVNEHTSNELAELRRELDIRKEFDHLATALAQRLGVTVNDLTGR